MIVAIINKDATKSLPIKLPGFTGSLVMHAASLTSTKVELTEPAGLREINAVPSFTAVLLTSTRG